MDRGKAAAGLLIYGLGVALPTVGLLLQDKGIDNPALERISVGVLGLVAGRLVWQALRGPALPGPPLYWGINPWLLAAGLFALYLAWFTNLPLALAGRLEGSLFVVNQDHVVPLDALWPRILTSALCALGVALLVRALRTKQSPEQRRAIRIQKRMRKALRRQPLQGAS